MKNILIPVSQNAPKDKIRKCIHVLASKDSHKITLLHVVAVPTSEEYIEGMVSGSENVIEELRKKEEADFRKFAELLISDGYQVDISVPLGFFDEKFIHLSKEIQPDFVIMFTSGADSVLEDIFGTNTSYVFEKIKSPLFVVSYTGEISTLKKAAVGLHLENDNMHVLQQYFDFEKAYNLESSYIKIDNNFQLDIINDELVLEELQKLYPNKIQSITHRQHEDVAEGLEKYANESKADVIVLFTTHRNFVEKLFHKSVTKDMVLHSHKPLLIFHY